MVSAFDRVRNPQKIQEGRCSKFITEGFIICRWPTGPRNPFPPPNAHRAWLCHADRLWVIVSTSPPLGIDSGFTAMLRCQGSVGVYSPYSSEGKYISALSKVETVHEINFGTRIRSLLRLFLHCGHRQIENSRNRYRNLH